MDEILKKIYEQHDIVCNQKYDGSLPYSFHLKAVVARVKANMKYLKSQYTEPSVRYNDLVHKQNIVIIAGAGHDLIEDARMTLNDVRELVKNTHIADIIYACTEEKGRNRSERHSEKFFQELSQNRLAVFVKLCDIEANVIYSLLTNSSMYNKYKQEFPNLYERLYIKEEYEPLWAELKKLLHLKECELVL